MRNSKAAALALLLAAAPAGAKGLDAFPRAGELFPALVAAPKQFQFGVSRYDLQGRALSDLSLGHSWGLLRGRAGDQLWQWQWDARAMSFSRWADGGLEAVDLLGELPVSVRRGDISFEGAIFHESSHLGDDRSRRTGRTAIRTTATGLRLLAAVEPWAWLRAYGGPSFLLDTAPSPKRWALQAGLEATTGDLGLAKGFPIRLYIAEDLQMPERLGFNASSRLAGGFKIGYRESQKAVRIQLGWYNGYSYFGQFQAERERFADLSLIFEL